MQKILQNRSTNPEKVIELLAPFLTENRKKRIDETLNNRTKHITLILYDLYHEHNMSAVVRSCEAFGFQELHVIEEENVFRPSHGVAIGAQQWINIIRHSSSKRCITHLKKDGYTILAADPPENAKKTLYKQSFTIDQIDIRQGKIAIAFGKELDGLNDDIRNLCDGVVYIPLAGFTESLNVSVTAAICLYELRKKLGQLPKNLWGLSKEEKIQIKAEWYLRSLKHGEKILAKLLMQKGLEKSS